MEIKTQKKDGVALVLILIIVTSLTMTVMASIKIITKSHTKYTTGKGYGKAINTNKSTGKFICYKDENGNLKQVTLTYKLDGTYEKPANKQSLDASGNCSFEVQNSAETYKITLIGGGGGGAVPYAIQNFNKTIATPGENTIIVGSNQTRFKKLFQNYGEYIDEGTAFDVIYTNFFSNMNVILKAPDAPIKSGIAGAVGGTCIKNITGGTGPIIGNASDMLNNIFEYGQEPATKYASLSPVNNDNGYFKFGNKKLTAYGGLGAIYDNYHQLISPTTCTTYMTSSMPNNCKQILTSGTYGTLYTNKGVGQCYYHDGTNPSYLNSTGVTNVVSSASSISDAKVTLNGTYNVLNYENRDSNGIPRTETYTYNVGQDSTFNFGIKENTVDIYEALAGEPGAKTEFETKYLVDVGKTHLTISASNLGAGGKGGTASSRNGSAGGNTRLVLNTRAGQHTLVANGGAGGTTKYLTTLEGKLSTSTGSHISFSQNYQGKNGNQADYVISGDLGVSNLMAGTAQTNTAAAIKKATLPGSSGASGSLTWQGIRKEAGNPWIFYESQNGEKSLVDRNVNPYLEDSYPYAKNEERKYFTTSNNGGTGADGAIIIEW